MALLWTQHNLTVLRVNSDPNYPASAYGSNKKVGIKRVILILGLGNAILMFLSSLLMMESFRSNHLVHLGEEEVNNSIVNCFIAKTVGLSLPLHSHCKHLNHG